MSDIQYTVLQAQVCSAGTVSCTQQPFICSRHEKITSLCFQQTFSWEVSLTKSFQWRRADFLTAGKVLRSEKIKWTFSEVHNFDTHWHTIESLSWQNNLRLRTTVFTLNSKVYFQVSEFKKILAQLFCGSASTFYHKVDLSQFKNPQSNISSNH